MSIESPGGIIFKTEGNVKDNADEIKKLLEEKDLKNKERTDLFEKRDKKGISKKEREKIISEIKDKRREITEIANKINALKQKSVEEVISDVEDKKDEMEKEAPKEKLSRKETAAEKTKSEEEQKPKEVLGIEIKTVEEIGKMSMIELDMERQKISSLIQKMSLENFKKFGETEDYKKLNDYSENLEKEFYKKEKGREEELKKAPETIFSIEIKSQEEIEKMSMEELREERKKVFSRFAELRSEKDFDKIKDSEEYKKLLKYSDDLAKEHQKKRQKADKEKAPETKEKAPEVKEEAEKETAVEKPLIRVGEIIHKLEKTATELADKVSDIPQDRMYLLDEYYAGRLKDPKEIEEARKYHNIINTSIYAGLNLVSGGTLSPIEKEDPEKRMWKTLEYKRMADTLLTAYTVRLKMLEFELKRQIISGELTPEKRRAIGNFATGNIIDAEIVEERKEVERGEPEKKKGSGILSRIGKIFGGGKSEEEKKKEQTEKDLEDKLSNANNPEDLKNIIEILHKNFEISNKVKKGLDWYLTGFDYKTNEEREKNIAEMRKAIKDDRDTIRKNPLSSGFLNGFMLKLLDKIEEMAEEKLGKRDVEKEEERKEINERMKERINSINKINNIQELETKLKEIQDFILSHEDDEGKRKPFYEFNYALGVSISFLSMDDNRFAEHKKLYRVEAKDVFARMIHDLKDTKKEFNNNDLKKYADAIVNKIVELGKEKGRIEKESEKKPEEMVDIMGDSVKKEGVEDTVIREKDEQMKINEILNENQIKEIKQAKNLAELRKIIENNEINLRPLATAGSAAERYNNVLKLILDKFDSEGNLKEGITPIKLQRPITENIEFENVPEFFTELYHKLSEFEREKDRKESDKKPPKPPEPPKGGAETKIRGREEKDESKKEEKEKPVFYLENNSYTKQKEEWVNLWLDTVKDKEMRDLLEPLLYFESEVRPATSTTGIRNEFLNSDTGKRIMEKYATDFKKLKEAINRNIKEGYAEIKATLYSELEAGDIIVRDDIWIFDKKREILSIDGKTKTGKYAYDFYILGKGKEFTPSIMIREERIDKKETVNKLEFIDKAENKNNKKPPKPESGDDGIKVIEVIKPKIEFRPPPHLRKKETKDNSAVNELKKNLKNFDLASLETFHGALLKSGEAATIGASFNKELLEHYKIEKVVDLDKIRSLTVKEVREVVESVYREKKAKERKAKEKKSVENAASRTEVKI